MRLISVTLISVIIVAVLLSAAPQPVMSQSGSCEGGNGYSDIPSISADGRFVTFTSTADNLVAGDTNSVGDVFVHDRMTGKTSRVSIASDGTQGNDLSIAGLSNYPDPRAGGNISTDGRYISFESYASNLVAGDTNGRMDIFVHDRMTGKTSRVSIASDGTQGNAYSDASAISADGRFVTFMSTADNLVAGDTNSVGDVFVHDRMTGKTSRVSIASDGTQGNDLSIAGLSNYPDPRAGGNISTDGRYISFESYASNLVAGDTNGRMDIFVHDRMTGKTSRVSIASDGTQGNTRSSVPFISADGQFVSFMSSASNLVDNDTNNTDDIFVRDRMTGKTTRVSVASDGTQGNGESGMPSISADGRFVSFYSEATNLVAGDTNGAYDVFVHDRQTGETTRVSEASNGDPANGGSYFASISADGRFVSFASEATNLVAGDTNGAYDVFVHDRQTGETTRVSVSSGCKCKAGEWVTEYYSNTELSGLPVSVVCEDSIDFYWGDTAPIPELSADSFSVRWQRTVDFDTSGWYNFRTFTDDGVRLYVDGERIINDWTARPFDERSAMKKLSAGPHDVVMEYFEDSGEALAHLTWYRTLLCDESDSQCSPLVDDAMYQTPFHGPMGTNCEVAPFIPGTSRRYVQTFAGFGCQVTSVGMSLQHIGITVTPDKLNEWLSEDRYVNECTGYPAEMKVYQDFAAAPDGYASGEAQNLVWQGVSSEVEAEKTIREGYPVVFQAWGNKAKEHYILVADIAMARHPLTAKTQQTFGIYDPHHAWNCWASLDEVAPPKSTLMCKTPPTELMHATTLDEEIVYLGNGGSSPLGYLKQREGKITPALQIDSENVELLLVKEHGGMIGYDRIKQQIVNTLANAMYFSPLATTPGQTILNLLLKRIFLPENADSKYQMFVINADPTLSGSNVEEDSSYTVTIIGFDNEQKPTVEVLTGSIPPGEIVTYDIDFSTGSDLSVVPVNQNDALYLPLLQR